MLEEVEGTPAAPAAGRWSMLVADRGRMHHVDLDEINRLGEEGWELVAIIHESRTQTPEVHFYFKRPRV